MTKPARKVISGWVISDGRRGIENQALGLAESLARQFLFEFSNKTIKNKGLFAALPPRLQYWLGWGLKSHGLAGEPLPDIIIGCGRQAIAPLLAAKAKYPDIFTIYIQNPRLASTRFDAVIAPEHDDCMGENVFAIIGAPNRITKAGLVEAAEKLPLKAANNPSAQTTALAGWLVGGTSKNFRLDGQALSTQIELAKQVLAEGYNIYITTSRRTPDIARAAYREFADQNKHVRLYDGRDDEAGENPYLALLGQADVIFATQDSTNMLTESCTAGKPLFLLPMTGRAGKFQILYDALAARCHVRPYFGGAIEGKLYPPLQETDRAAKAVWVRYQARQKLES